MRHTVELGRSRVLHHHQPGFFFDRTEPKSAVGAHTGQDDTDTVLLLIIGKGAEKEIDRQTQTAWRRRFEQMQHAMQDRHVLVGRDHVNRIRLDPHPVLHLVHLHTRRALQQFGQNPFVSWIKVLDDDKADATLLRDLAQKLLQGLQSPRRSADTDDG